MADTLKVFEGSLMIEEATIYTVPADKALIITEMRLTNTHATVGYDATVKVGTDTVIFPAKEIGAKDGYVQSDIHTVILTGKTIKGSAEADTVVKYYISGIEVDV